MSQGGYSRHNGYRNLGHGAELIVIRILSRLWLTAGLLGLLVILLPEKPKQPILTRDGWKTTGQFFQNTRPGIREVSTEIARNEEAVFWRSWSPETKAVAGRVETLPFEPPRYLSIPYVGYPFAHGVSLYLECEKTGARLNIASGNTHERWTERILRIPPSWCLSKTRLVAESDSQNDYVGVGTPFKASRLSWLKESAATVIWIHGVGIFLLLGPGVAGWLLLSRRGGISMPVLLCWPAGTLLTGYALFFIFFESRTVGRIVAHAIMLGCALLLAARWRSLRLLLDDPEIKIPLTLFVGMSLFYTLFLYSLDVGAGSFAATYRWAPAVWSTDNQLPQIVADGLYNLPTVLGAVRPWHVSDRPPLMSGLFLLGWSLWQPLLALGSNARMDFLVFQIAGIVASSLWIIPLWMLARAARMSHQRASLLVILVGTTGFAVFNSTYIWPKMLSAALGFSALVIIESIRERSGTKTLRRYAWIAVFLALAMLSHGGVVFGVVPLIVYLWWISGEHRIRGFALAAVVGVTLLAPWVAWQKLIDPPGNSLVKFAFAGTFGFGEEQQGVIETIRHAYGSLTFGDWLALKRDGLLTLFGLYVPPAMTQLWRQPMSGLGSLRLYEFQYVLPALCVANMGWPLLAWQWLRCGKRSVCGGFRTTPFQWTGLGVAGILLPVAISWGQLVVHHHSYVAMLLLMTGLFGILLDSGGRLAFIAASLQLSYFSFVWVISPLLDRAINWGCLAASGASALFVGYVLLQLGERGQS